MLLIGNHEDDGRFVHRYIFSTAFLLLKNIGFLATFIFYSPESYCIFAAYNGVSMHRITSRLSNVINNYEIWTHSK